MAYVLGFIYADGAVEDCRKSSRTCYLSMTNTDLELLKKIRDAMSSSHNIYLRKGGPAIIKGKRCIQRDCHVLRIGSKIMYQDLTDLGLCPRKSLIIKMPVVFEKLFNYFLRGYFDGDGCIHIDKLKRRLKIIFTSGSGIFLDQLKKKMNLNGCIVDRHGTYQLVYGGRFAEKVAYLIYQDINRAPYLEYKYKKYRDYLKEKGLRS